MTLLKRIMIVSCLGLPLLATAQSKSVPYTSALGGDADWTTINANNDDQAWETDNTASDFNGTGFNTGIRYRYDRNNAADDWYISPAITLEAGKEYKIKYWYKTSGYDEKFTLYCATANTPEALIAGTAIDEFDGQQTTFTLSKKVFTPATSGDYHFAFYAHSDKDKLNLFITGFQIAENVFGPGAPTDVTVTPGADNALTAALSWKLPTVDNDGEPLPEGYTVNNVKIYRDDALVATLDGAATTWTDTAEAGLTSGKHRYEVQVTINDAASARAGVDSAWIGPIVAQSLPWDADIENLSENDFSDFYTELHGEVSTLTGTYGWQRVSSYYNGTEIQLYMAGNKRADNWLVLPKLVFPEAGVYKLSLNGKYSSDTSSNEVVLDLYLGTEKTIENLSAGRKGTIERMPTAYVDREIYFRVDEAGEYYPALYASGKTGSADLCIKSMKIEKSFETCTQPTALTATVADGTVTIAWTNPSTNNMGTTLSGNLSKIEILRGEELVQAITDQARLAAGANASTTDTPTGNGVFTYTVRPYFDGHEAFGTPATVATPWIGDPTQQLPYSTNFGTQIERSLFTTVGMSENASTWTLSNDGAELETPTGDGNKRTLNDLLMTPPFDLTEGYYKVTVSLTGGAAGYPIKFGLVAYGNENHALIDPQTLDLTSYNMTRDIYLKADAAGKYNVGILAESEITNCANIVITHLQVREQPITPAVATDLTVTVDPEDIYSAVVTWKNPATCNIPNVVPAITKVEILRDDELLTTITDGLVAGELSSYTDTGVGAEHPGKHNYEVKAYSGENTASYGHPKVLSPWIGDAVKAPYEPETFQDFETVAQSGTRTWSINSMGYAYFWGSTTPTNAWLFSPLLQIEKGAEYEISLTPYQMSEYNDPGSFKAYVGTAATIDAMTTELGEITGSQILSEATPATFTIRGVDPDEPATAAEGEGETGTVFSVPAGNIAVGFHASELGECYVRYFKFIQTVFPPVTGITEIETAADGDAVYYNLQGVRVLNPQGGIYIRVKDGRSQKVIIRK